MRALSLAPSEPSAPRLPMRCTPTLRQAAPSQRSLCSPGWYWRAKLGQIIMASGRWGGWSHGSLTEVCTNLETIYFDCSYSGSASATS